MNPRAVALLLCAIACGAHTATAQAAHFLGFTAGFETSYTDRGGADTTNVDLLQVFSGRHYRHAFVDPADPTGQARRIVGLRVVVQDQVGFTPEQYTMVGYLDDPLQPGRPDVRSNGAGVWFRTGRINTPPNASTGPAVHTLLVGINPPPTPARFGASHGPTDDDLYLGIGLQAGTWPNEGLGCRITADFMPNVTAATPRDVVGPRLPASPLPPNLVCTVATTGGAFPLPTGAAALFPGIAGRRGDYRQLDLDVLTYAPGGVAVTQTNQLYYATSRALTSPSPTARVPLGGTTNMLSGLHPDLHDATALIPPPPSSFARADDIGFLITDGQRPNAIALARLSFGPLLGGSNADGSQPVAQIPGFGAPGSGGNVCVDLADPNGITFFGTTNAFGRFQAMVPMSAATRAFLRSYGAVDVTWQGFVIDLAATPFEARATGCVTQRL